MKRLSPKKNVIHDGFKQQDIRAFFCKKDDPAKSTKHSKPEGAEKNVQKATIDCSQRIPFDDGSDLENNTNNADFITNNNGHMNTQIDKLPFEEDSIIIERTVKNTPESEVKLQSVLIPKKKKKVSEALLKTPKKTAKKTSPIKKSPTKSPQKDSNTPSPKKSKKEISYFLKVCNKLIDTVLKSKHLNGLLEPKDKAFIEVMKKASPTYQFICFKLCKWAPKWYRIQTFVQYVQLSLEDHEIIELFEFLKSNNVVDTDYNNENMKVILNCLEVKDVINICKNLRISKQKCTKDELIEKILSECATRSTLTCKGTIELVKLEIKKYFGKYVVKINNDFLESFFRIFTLSTFTNPDLQDMDQYFRIMTEGAISFPDFVVEDYPVFYSPAEFTSYREAKKYETEAENNNNNHLLLFTLAKDIYDIIKKNPQNNTDKDRFKETPFLKRFTSESVYRKLLSTLSCKLYTKYPRESKEWLEFLIKAYPDSKFLCKWYCTLCQIYNNLKDKERAGDLLIEALKNEKFNDVEVETLKEKAQYMKTRVNPIQQDKLIDILLNSINTQWPDTTIERHAVRGNVPGRKRDYVVSDLEGNKTYSGVESMALDHYIKNEGFTNGEHDEGSIIKSLLAIYFWDIIYSPSNLVPGVFLSELQYYPLDFFTPYFYENRKQLIDQRLEDLSKNWSDEEMCTFGKNSWEMNKDKRTFCRISNNIQSSDFINDIVTCIGRNVLARIFERLVKNLHQYRSGLPDLFVWNVQEKKAMFVEVKGENDTLSVKQKLWLNYLQQIGANIQVCYVHSIGSKKKLTGSTKTDSKTNKNMKDNCSDFSTETKDQSMHTTPKKRLKANKTVIKKFKENSVVQEESVQLIRTTPKKTNTKSKENPIAQEILNCGNANIGRLNTSSKKEIKVQSSPSKMRKIDLIQNKPNLTEKNAKKKLQFGENKKKVLSTFLNNIPDLNHINSDSCDSDFEPSTSKSH